MISALAVGILDVSSVRFISLGLSSLLGLGIVWEGEGDKTTEGIREWLWCVPLVLSEAIDGDVVGDGASKSGFQVDPGFTTKLTISPSRILYSFRSLVSARALPFNKRRWMSAGGAFG